MFFVFLELESIDNLGFISSVHDVITYYCVTLSIAVAKCKIRIQREM